MENAMVHSNPTTLGPFLRRFLTLAEQEQVETSEHLHGSAGRPPGLTAPRQELAPETTQRVFVFRHSTALGPFLTLLLTLHHGDSFNDHPRCQHSRFPLGAALAVRYVSL